MGIWRIGVDLGGTKTAVGLVAEDGSVVARRRFPTVPERPASDFLSELAATVSQVAEARPDGGSPSDCLVGVGVPGTPDYASGSIVCCSNLRWDGLALGPLLGQRLALRRPVLVDQDTKAAALAEKLFGAAQRWEDFLCILVGTGIGAAIFVNGRLCRGWRAAAGEIAYMVAYNRPGDAVPAEASALPGARGWPFAAMLESVVSGLAIRRAGGADAAAVFAAAAAGDARARRIAAETARVLALAIMNAVHLLNPEGVILGGGVSQAGDLLWDALRAEIRASECYPPCFAGLPIVPPGLGVDAPLVGAAFLDQSPPLVRPGGEA